MYPCVSVASASLRFTFPYFYLLFEGIKSLSLSSEINIVNVKRVFFVSQSQWGLVLRF